MGPPVRRRVQCTFSVCTCHVGVCVPVCVVFMRAYVCVCEGLWLCGCLCACVCVCVCVCVCTGGMCLCVFLH